MTHTITGEEPFLHRTLASLGVPPLHILRAYNTQEYRFYELTGDLDEALHFHDFDDTSPRQREEIRERIHLGEPVNISDPQVNPAHGKIFLRD